MYWGIDVKVILALVAGAVLFLAGWFTNGYRWETRYATMQKNYAEQVIEAQRAARRKEALVQSQMDIQQVAKNAEIKDIRDRLDRALAELRQRPARLPVPGNSSVTGRATGAELSREDAEFLAREAARADEVVSQLQYCRKVYEDTRTILNQGNP